MDKFDQARLLIQKQFGVRTSFGGETEFVYGVNREIDTSSAESIWITGGDETYVTDNVIDAVSSSSVSDSNTLLIEGHTISDEGFVRVRQLVTLNGQNKVTLSIPLARVGAVVNTGAVNLAGTVYVYEDDTIVGGVPQTQSNIHLTLDSGNQSKKGAITIDKDNYFVIDGIFLSVLKNQNAVVDFTMQIRNFGGVFRDILPVSVVQGSKDIPIYTVPLLQPNQDIRIKASVSSNETQVSCYYSGFYMNILK